MKTLEITLDITDEQLKECKAAGPEDLAYLIEKHLKSLMPNARVSWLTFDDRDWKRKEWSF